MSVVVDDINNETIINNLKPSHSSWDKGIWNFRKMTPDNKGNFYRSGTLNNASEAEVTLIKDILNVKTIVDLRRKEKLSNECNISLHYKSIQNYDVANPTPLRWMNVDLFRFFPVLRMILMQGFYNIVKTFYTWGTTSYNTAKRFMVNHSVGQLNLKGFYAFLGDNCQSGIKDAVKILCAPNQTPLILCCQHGKDRTGIISALVCSALGYDREAICASYAESEINLKPVSKHIAKHFHDDGLDISFSFSPPEVMKSLLDYLDIWYGGPVGYLHWIGITKEDLVQLRLNVFGKETEDATVEEKKETLSQMDNGIIKKRSNI